jgi:sigma-54-specific transcriptional regulator
MDTSIDESIDKEVAQSRYSHHQLIGSNIQPLAANTQNSSETDSEAAWVALDQAFLEVLRSPHSRLFHRIQGRFLGLAFQKNKQNQVRTAGVLGVSRNVLRTLLRRHGFLR